MPKWQVHKETRLACKIIKNRREKDKEKEQTFVMLRKWRW